MIKVLFLSLMVLFFDACAPVYKVQREYIFPSDSASKECVRNCDISKSDCKRDCELRYQSCLNEAFNKAKDIKALSDMEYSKKLYKYRVEYDNYYRSLDAWQRAYDQSYKDFRYFSKQCKKFHQKYACKRRQELKYILYRLDQNRPKEPIKPQRESFESILSKQQSYCKSDCGCDRNYDICFNGCGGKIVLQRVCVENCDNN